MISINNILKKAIKSILIALPLYGGVAGGLLLTSCQDRDLPGTGEMVLPAPDASTVTSGASGTNNYDYTITWTPSNNGADMYVAVYRDWGMQQELTKQNGNTFTLANIETGVEYEFLLKYKKVIDGVEYTSPGTVIKYTRNGAQKVGDLAMKQVEQADGVTQNIEVTWTPSPDATSYEVTYYKDGSKQSKTLDASAKGMTIADVKIKDTWTVEVVSVNAEGKSLPVVASLLIGKTKFAFLSQYATPDLCVANGDDDEAAAWLWFHANYPDGKFLYFGDIKSANDLAPYRMLFWMYDIETGNGDDVWNLLGAETAKAAAPYVKQFVQDGGNLLLWQHAVMYIGYIERIGMDTLRGLELALGCGAGGINNDTWKMGSAFKGDDHVVNYSIHPVFKGMKVETEDSGRRLVPCKGPGWTEDHNCAFAGLPSILTGEDSHSNACYDKLTQEHGIYPLGTWDFWWEECKQLNIWEAKAAPKAPNGYDKGGSIICVGNGGFEFSMKNNDGTPDKSATPKNNSNQDNILKFAKNCIDYLMSI